MLRIAIVCLAIGFPLVAAHADLAETLRKVDDLHEQGAYADCVKLLADSLPGVSAPKDKAEVLWRMARGTLELGDQSDNSKAPVASTLKIFEEGEAYATRAIEADPQNADAYYYKGSNIGRWGQVKGILDSLFKAGPMRDQLEKALDIRPDFSDAYYVLGQLYDQVPGFISFGNMDYAVSLGRKSVDLRVREVQNGVKKELGYDYYTELGKHLWKRGWSAQQRLNEQKNKRTRAASAKTILEKAFYYEGEIELKNLTDKEEAKAMLQWAIAELEKIPSRKPGQNDDLKEARDVLKGW
jgi:tetratricopeptide (TPR) repeat protein